MKRIVIVTDAWHPQVNGVVTSIAKIADLLEKKGFGVTVIHPGLFWTVPLPFYKEIRLSLVTRRKIKNMIGAEKPDYIHIATEGPLGLAARAACQQKKLQFTTSYHTHFARYVKARVGAISKTVYADLRWFHNTGASTMASTESLKSELENEGFKNVVVWPLGVDTELFKRNKHPPLESFVKPVFVYFGRIAVEKSVEEYLRCALPGTKLVIGDGPDRKKLEKIYGASARFVSYKKGQELVDWLSLCDVFVFPSRTETFGLVVLEALSCGIPVAAHDVMGPKDIITPGVDGFLDENLERAALACLKLSREKCRQKALLYSWGASADAFVKNLHSANFLPAG